MKRPEYLVSGELARLIPVAAKPELRSTCATCAVLMAVDEFATVLFGALGAPTGKRAKASIWVEPVFKSRKKEDKDRPDALIIIDNGRREWRALVEAKANKTDLCATQVERYLDIARAQGIDAVLTISNQFVATPNQSPCDIDGRKLKKVSLFHWSWSYLKTEAKIQSSKSVVSDPDQAYMLDEYVRYLEHEAAGVDEFDQMGRAWVEASKVYFAKSKLSSGSKEGAEVLRDWNELIRSTSLLMSRELETNVTNVLSNKERKDPSGWLEAKQEEFIVSGVLQGSLDVPNAASAISVEADLNRRSVTVSMVVGAPKDKKRTKSTVTWLLRQLEKTEVGNIMLVAKWPGRTKDTSAELAKVKEDVSELIGDRTSQLPHTFEIRAVSDLGGRFTQPRKFVPELIGCVTGFYSAVGQYLVPWQALPPKLKKNGGSETEDRQQKHESGGVGAQQSAPGDASSGAHLN